MKKQLEKKGKKIVKRIFGFMDWISRNWLIYSYVRTGFIIIFFPLLFHLGASAEAPPFEIYKLAVFAGLVSTVIFFLDSKKGSVVGENPYAFVKSEKMKDIVEKLYYILIVLLLSFIFLIIPGIEKLGFEDWIKPTIYVMSPLWHLFIGTFMYVLIGFFEVVIEKLEKPPKPFLRPEYFVPPTLQARARLVVVLKTLSEKPDIKTINKRLPLFKEAIGIYNNHLRQKFDFVLRRPEKFYRYAKLAAYAQEKMMIDDVMKGLEVFIFLMERKDDDPFEVVKSLKGMIKESVSIEDVFDEIDVEPKRLQKWFSAHSNSIKGVIALLSLITTILVRVIK